MRIAANPRSALIIGGVLAAWIFWLRWPYFARPIWNLDEGIYATIARTILAGGVMYRDAIDLRTPLTYYLVAGIFRIFGENNLWAVHAVLAGMIAATALGLFLIGRRWRGTAAGVWAALVFCAFTTNLFYIGDSYALSTEWLVILFTTWSTWWIWRTWEQNSLWSSALGGIGFAAAFLSKQPGLLDFGAPLATVIYAAATGQLGAGHAARRLTGLCAGFVGLTALVFAYFRAHGALDDMYFYAWSYNLVYYGPETTAADRLQAAGEVLRVIWRQYPVIGVALAAAVPVLVFRLRPTPPAAGKRQGNPAAFYLLVWGLLSWAGSASAGRIYHHYHLQVLPAFTLLAGGLFADCQSLCLNSRKKWLQGLAGLILAVAAWTVVAGPLRGPWPATLGPGGGAEAAAYIQARTRPEVKIFVWGFSPDFYVLADRRAASRYVYCSFLTGLIPWTNSQPERDTRYAIVPGAMDLLLAELAANRPPYIVDTSLGGDEHFLKYPLARFPRLAAFVTANYVEVEPVRLRPHGFRVLMLKDSFRQSPQSLAEGASSGPPGELSVSGPTNPDPRPVEYEVRAAQPAARLQRLELLVDGAPVDSRTFDPTPAMTARFVVHFERLGRGWHQLAARVTLAGGQVRTGQALAVECMPESLPAEQRAAFALQGHLPERVVSAFLAAAGPEAGVMVFFAHAPSVISYRLVPGAARLRGRFGFRPGAYAATNPGPTDGATFIVTWIHPDGRQTELLRRWLRPREEPADRGEHPFDLALPATATGGTLELAIDSGPAGRTASDWTYWSDLLLSTSR